MFVSIHNIIMISARKNQGMRPTRLTLTIITVLIARPSYSLAQSTSLECSLPVRIGSVGNLDNPTNITIHDGFAYIIEEQGSMAIVDLTNPSSPRLTGRLDRVWGGYPIAVTVHNDVAYITDQDERILVVNVEDKSDPWFFRSYSGLPSIPGGPLPSSNGYLFVSQSAALSLSRPMSPAFDAFISPALTSTPFHVDGNELITRNRSRYDISNPLEPTLIHQGSGPNLDFSTRYDAPYLFSFDTNGVQVTTNHIPIPELITRLYDVIGMSDATIRGENLYAANNSLGVFTLDHPPHRIAHYNQTHGMIPAKLIRQLDDYFVILSESELVVYDIPTNPLAGAHTQASEEQFARIGDTLIATSTTPGIDSSACSVIDLSNPRRPVWIAQLTFPISSPIPVGVATHDQFVYIAERYTGVHAFDLSDTHQPVHLGSQAISSPIRDIRVESGILYLIDESTGLHTFAIESDSSLTPIGFIAIEDSLQRLTLMGNLALVSSDAVAYLIDIADPSDPIYRSTILGESFLTPSIPSAHRDGDLLYAAENSSGYRIYNITDPTDPTEIAQFDADITTPDWTYEAFVHDILVDGLDLYLSMGTGGFAIYDNTNPFAPVLRSHAPAHEPGSTSATQYRSFEKVGQQVYLTSASAGIRVLSLSGCTLPCVIDYNQDGTLNFFDVAAFIAAFNVNDPIADLVPDGSFNFFDIAEFLVRYQDGCE